MKSLLIGAFSLIVSASFAQEQKDYPLKAEVNIVKKGYFPFSEMGIYGLTYSLRRFCFNKIYNIELNIKNTSGKTAYLLAITCSWEASLIFSNEYVEYMGNACAGNFPSIRTIKPGGREIFKTNLALVLEPCYTYVRLMGGWNINTRLGFIVVNNIFKEKEYSLWSVHLYKYAQEKRNQKAIIWSNPINLN